MRILKIDSKKYIIKGKVITFLEKVRNAILLDDKIIVELNVPLLMKNHPEIEYWRAVFAYDFEGNVIWQVENPWYIDPETGKRIEYDNNNEKEFPGGDCVGSVLYNPRLKMIVAWGRVGYQLDTNTGKLLAIVSRER